MERTQRIAGHVLAAAPCAWKAVAGPNPPMVNMQVMSASDEKAMLANVEKVVAEMKSMPDPKPTAVVVIKQDAGGPFGDNAYMFLASYSNDMDRVAALPKIIEMGNKVIAGPASPMQMRLQRVLELFGVAGYEDQPRLPKVGDRTALLGIGYKSKAALDKIWEMNKDLNPMLDMAADMKAAGIMTQSSYRASPTSQITINYLTDEKTYKSKRAGLAPKLWSKMGIHNVSDYIASFNEPSYGTVVHYAVVNQANVDQILSSIKGGA